MKRFVVILLAFLSLVLGGGQARAATSFRLEPDSSVSESVFCSIRVGGSAAMGKDLCLVSLGGNAFSGNTTSHGGSVRLSQTGRRVNPTVRSAVRFFKSGKMLDLNLAWRNGRSEAILSFLDAISQSGLISSCNLRL